MQDVTAEFYSFRDTLSRPDNVTDVKGDVFTLEAITYLPPTTDYNAIYCAALNFGAHEVESDMSIPEQPWCS